MQAEIVSAWDRIAVTWPASLASTPTGFVTSRPEIQLFAVGSPDALDRTVDVAALSSWLALRAIDRETRRLDSIERGARPPLPASIPPRAAAGAPDPAASDQPLSEVPMPDRNPHQAPPKPRLGVPRPPAAPPTPNAPAVSQQLAPLPPPIEVRPAPGAGVARPPKPKPPLVLTPPVTSPQRSAF